MIDIRGENVNKEEFVCQLADKYGYTKKSAAELIDAFTSTILDNIALGNTVSIYGFGCFDIIERKERSVISPKDGERVSIPAHWVPRFYPGARMKDAVQKWEIIKDRE